MTISIEQTFKRTLTVDVGDHTGWAFWDGQQDPKDWGMLVLDKHIDGMENQLGNMQIQFKYLLEELKPRLCILEGVEFWAGNLRSVTAAKRGNLSKLSYLVGMYGASCFERGISIRIIPAREWKGQLKDPMVLSRVQDLTGIQLKKSEQHIADAIGMGLSLQGMFYRTVKNPQRLKRFKIVKT